MTLHKLFRKAARLLAESPKWTACMAVAKASGRDVDTWSVGQKLFCSYFKPEDKTPLAEWWHNRGLRCHNERTLALLFMAEITRDA